jgi:FG-GAP-like repeat
VDLDNDGIQDLISGSWPGEIYFFKGRGHGAFDAPVKLKGKNGKSINVTGGIQRNNGQGLLVAGDAKFEQKDGKQYIVYEGEWTEFKPGDQGGITGTASVVQAVDLDQDGDLDLIVGNIRGDVYFVPNEGSAQAWAFGTEQRLLAGGAAIHVAERAGPYVGDWDGDGKVDLLVGSGDGSVWFYRNTGQRDATKLPVFAAGRELVPAAAPSGYGADASPTPTRGGRAKVCIADWNGDGRPDLLVGDLTTQKPDRPDPTPEQKAEQDKLRAQLKELEPRYGQALEKLRGPGAKSATAQERERAAKAFSEVSQQVQVIRQKLPPEYENHGWVWLFLRKPVGR